MTTTKHQDNEEPLPGSAGSSVGDDPMMAAEEWLERKCDMFGILLVEDEAEEYRSIDGRWMHCWDYKIIWSTERNLGSYLRITDDPTAIYDPALGFTIYPPDPDSYRQVEMKLWEWTEKCSRIYER